MESLTKIVFVQMFIVESKTKLQNLPRETSVIAALLCFFFERFSSFGKK